MKQLRVRVVSNKKVGVCFYMMKLESGYLAKKALPGQFVEIQCTKGVDPLLRRPLGIHRIEGDGIEVLYEVVGKGTRLLSEKRPGEDIDVIGPLGSGFDLGLASDINILIAGGIGVAPLIALAERLSKERNKKIYVMIGARTKSHVMCEKEFRSLGCIVKTATDDGSKGYKGFVIEPVEKMLATCRPETYLPAFRQVAIYACGPTGMLEAVSRIAHEHGIPCQVSLEERMACGVGVCLGCPVKVKTGEYKMVCKDGPVFGSEEIIWE